MYVVYTMRQVTIHIFATCVLSKHLRYRTVRERKLQDKIFFKYIYSISPNMFIINPTSKQMSSSQ
jgi:hypothetical protein